MLINVFGEVINPYNVTYLKDVKDRNTIETRTYFTSTDERDVGNLPPGEALFSCIEFPNKTKLEVMEEINRQIKESKS